MSSVWKRLQRVGKRATKFRFVAAFHELMIEGSNKWYVIYIEVYVLLTNTNTHIILNILFAVENRIDSTRLESSEVQSHLVIIDSFLSFISSHFVSFRFVSFRYIQAT
jgi:hypothetical protein